MYQVVPGGAPFPARVPGRWLPATRREAAPAAARSVSPRGSSRHLRISPARRIPPSDLDRSAARYVSALR